MDASDGRAMAQYDFLRSKFYLSVNYLYRDKNPKSVPPSFLPHCIWCILLYRLESRKRANNALSQSPTAELSQTNPTQTKPVSPLSSCNACMPKGDLPAIGHGTM
jgi:hypothetical protein